MKALIFALSTILSPLPPQWGLTMVHAQQAWSLSQGQGVTVCVIDSGASQNSDVTVTASTNVVDPQSTDASDTNGHATHVSGIIAGHGVIQGVAPRATLLAAKVLGAAGSGSAESVEAGIFWCVRHHAQVANLSLGGPGSPADGEVDAIKWGCSQGMDFAVAAGNDGLPNTGESPASVRSPCLIAVNAVDESENVADFSNYLQNPREVSAPGQNVLSDWINNSYTLGSGTSMAAPFVAGELALLRSMGLTATEAVNVVLGTTDVPRGHTATFKHGVSPFYGFGIINCQKAVREAATFRQ